MKVKNGFIAACSGLCILAEGVNVNEIPDFPEARRSVIEHYMPRGTYGVLNALSRQADESFRPIMLENGDDTFTELGFDRLTEVEKRSIEKLFSLENRLASFVRNGLIVHPTKDIEEKIKRRTNAGLFILGGKLKG
jgi:hypothetical protein